MKLLMRRLLCLGLICASLPALAGVEVTEGDKAKAMLEKDKKTSSILKQHDKKFTLKTPDGHSVEAPKETTVAAGTPIFISNDEETIVHNVYDESDHSWVLKKQLPSTVAAVTFSEPSVHTLRCAIHPSMKITVTVKEPDTKAASAKE